MALTTPVARRYERKRAERKAEREAQKAKEAPNASGLGRVWRVLHGFEVVAKMWGFARVCLGRVWGLGLHRTPPTGPSYNGTAGAKGLAANTEWMALWLCLCVLFGGTLGSFSISTPPDTSNYDVFSCLG